MISSLDGVRIAAALLTACSSSPPAPVLATVTPDWAYNGENTSILIEGENLLPGLDLHAWDGERSTVIDTFEVRLIPEGGSVEGAIVLEGPKLVEVGQIRALVPQGQPVGMYDLEVVTPFGGRAELPDGFRVVDTRADGFGIELPEVVWEVGQETAFDVMVVDRSGEPLQDDRAVQLIVSSRTDRVPDVSFAAGSLADQATLGGDLVGVAGRVGPDGRATLRMTVEAPDKLRLTVRSDPSDGDQLRQEQVDIDARSGEVAGIRLTVNNSLAYVAGDSVQVQVAFVDASDRLVPDAALTVALATSCGEVEPVVADVAGTDTMVISPTRATGTPTCRTMRVIANGGGGITGESEPLAVLPGPLVGLDVTVAEGQLQAGQPIPVFAFGRDQYGNQAVWDDSVFAVRDPWGPVQGFECSNSVPTLCTVFATRADPAVVLEFEDTGGVTGRSQPFELASGPASAVEFDLPLTWTAGESTAVELRLLDAWGNPIPPDVVDPAAVQIRNLNGGASCVPSDPQPADALGYVCEVRLASAEDSFHASLLGLEIEADSETFRVVNGPLGALSVEVSAGEVGVTQPLGVTVRATDDWGNPWIVQEDDTLVVLDPEDKITPDTVQIGQDGTVSFNLQTVRSGNAVRFLFEGAGGVIGESPPVVVRPGPLASLEVTVDAPWVTVGEDLRVFVESLDAWGNRSESLSVVTLTSNSGAGVPVSYALINGAGEARFRWSSAVPGDFLTASSDLGASAQSPEVLVLRECVNGPTASLVFGATGTAEGVGCTGPGGVTTIAASLAGSRPYAPLRPITRYGILVEGGGRSTSASPLMSATAFGEGRFLVRGVAVQEDGCGQEVRSYMWVGPDDGTPVGPIVMNAAATQLDLAGPQPFTDVSIVGAKTCREVWAANTELFVRTDRGALSGVVTGSSGLLVSLNGVGDAAFRLDASGLDVGGTATLYADVPSEAAQGVEVVQLLGDRRPPHVWSQDPKGGIAVPYNTVVLGFSEPLDPLFVSTSGFSVTGQSAPNLVQVIWQASPPEATLVLDTNLQPGQAYVVLANTQLRDLAGNRLDGAWTGAGTGYTGPVGVATNVSPIVTCSLSTPEFRPDGADGAGREADFVELSWIAGSSPAWWVIEVLDDADEVVEVQYLVPGGLVDSWTWDGRDAGGRIVDPGPWTVRVAAEVNLGDRSLPCERVVDLKQRGVR